jgi:hypothetical protein
LPHHLANALYDLVNVFFSLLLAFQQPVCQFAPSFAIAAAYPSIPLVCRASFAAGQLAQPLLLP